MPVGRRRIGHPGVVGTMARTAVVAGTATAVSGNVARRLAARHDQSDAAAAQAQAQQQQEWAQQQQWAQEQAAAAAPAGEDTIAQLKELAALHEQGVLTDAEFAAQKAKLLG